ncbi:MAG TPA: hypothetical protein VFR24_27410 [Candidatus Angelobacter sp.]|nr:hypothetical protein [Candidatus Angelobacter sp.]
MSQGIQLFEPQTTATVSITCSTVTARVALVATAAVGFSLRIKNIDTTNVAYVELGGSTVSASVPNGATPGSMPVGPGETVGVGLSNVITNVAAVSSAGTPTVYFTPGTGV